MVPQDLVDVMTTDTSRLPWSVSTVERIPTETLHSDPETGVQFFLVHHPAGFTNVRHTHRVPTGRSSWTVP